MEVLSVATASLQFFPVAIHAQKLIINRNESRFGREAGTLFLAPSYAAPLGGDPCWRPGDVEWHTDHFTHDCEQLPQRARGHSAMKYKVQHRLQIAAVSGQVSRSVGRSFSVPKLYPKSLQTGVGGG